MWSQNQFEQDIQDLEDKLNVSTDDYQIKADIKYGKEKVTFYYKDLETRQRDHDMTASYSIDDMEENGVSSYFDNLLP